jgi:hypothetical protein
MSLYLLRLSFSFKKWFSKHMANHIDSEKHLKFYGRNHQPLHKKEYVNPFPGFGTGWYFPESLRVDPLLEIPGLEEASIPSFDEYLAAMQRRLAIYALYEEGKLNDPVLKVEIEAQEARIASLPPIILPPIEYK